MVVMIRKSFFILKNKVQKVKTEEKDLMGIKLEKFGVKVLILCRNQQKSVIKILKCWRKKTIFIQITITKLNINIYLPEKNRNLF